MDIVKLNSNNKLKILALANDIINRGGTVVYPTETSYGLGADFFDPQAYAKVVQIKQRPKDKILPTIVGSINQVLIFAKLSPTARFLAEKYWPGPLTLVLPLAINLNNKLFTVDSVAVRVSSHPFAQDLTRVVARPLISTSANLFGQPNCYDVRELVKQFKNRVAKPNLIIDAGLLPKTESSTIVAVNGDQIKILRQGPVKINNA